MKTKQTELEGIFVVYASGARGTHGCRGILVVDGRIKDVDGFNLLVTGRVIGGQDCSHCGFVAKDYEGIFEANCFLHEDGIYL